MKASDIMTTNIVTIDSSATIAEAARVMQWNKLRTLIVSRDSEEDAYGIITQTDIASAIANDQNPETTYVAQVMTKPCIVVNPDLGIEHIVKLFARTKIRTAPVIKDKLLGIVSLTDIITKANCLTSNECLSSIEQEFNASKTEYYKPVSQDKIAELNEDIDDYLYQNWCSG